MGGHIPALGCTSWCRRSSAWVQFVLSTPVVLWAGWPFFERAWASVVNRSLNMFSLIALGTGAAYLYSLVATFAPGLFPAGFRGMDGTVAVYFEAAAVITVLVLLGQVLELRAREQTGGAIRALLESRAEDGAPADERWRGRRNPARRSAGGRPAALRPETACRWTEWCWRAGARLMNRWSPASPCRCKAAGDALIGGTVNGPVRSSCARTRSARTPCCRASWRWSPKRSAAARRSSAWPTPSSGYFVPAVLALPLPSLCRWAIWGPAPALAYALVAAVSVVIIACPCALGLATPMSIGVGVGKGAHAGVLIKSAEALERLEKVNTLVVDKTGTLTEGRAKGDRRSCPNLAFRKRTSSVSRRVWNGLSEHPLAAAIVAAAKERGIDVPEAADFASVTGKGVTGEVGERHVAIGNAKLMTGRRHAGDLTKQSR